MLWALLALRGAAFGSPRDDSLSCGQAPGQVGQQYEARPATGAHPPAKSPPG